MPDSTDVTTGYLDAGWLPPPTPGTPAARLMAESDAEVHAPLSGTGLVQHARAQTLIERSQK